MSNVLGAIGEAIGEAVGMKPDDQIIAEAALGAAKGKAMAYSAAVLETASPDLRHLFTTHLTDALAEHDRWTQMAINRDWYKAYASPEDLVRQALNHARPVLGQGS